MKKIFALVVTAALVFALAACSGGGDSSQPWTREGDFKDEEHDVMLSITPSDTDEYEGWYVGFYPGGDMYGWYIPQEGDTLHGDLLPDENDEFIVTVSEEGEDGVLLEVEGGETYHFVPAAEEEQTAQFTARINTEGMGQIAYADEGEEPQFNDEFPKQSAYIGAADAETHVIAAKADEGWKFVKWTKDGEDYSTEDVITIEVNEPDTEYIAVFEAE